MPHGFSLGVGFAIFHTPIPAFAGDVTCQLLAIEVRRREGAEETALQDESDEFLDDLGPSDVASEIDWARTARFTFVGATVLAPALHVWYGFLIRKLPGTAPATVVKRVLLDQLVFAPVFLAGFLSTVMVLDGNAAKARERNKPCFFCRSLRRFWFRAFRAARQVRLDVLMVRSDALMPGLWPSSFGVVSLMN